jgi:hypothetical protein
MRATTLSQTQRHFPTQNRRRLAAGRRAWLPSLFSLLLACQSAGGHRGDVDEPDASVSEIPQGSDLGGSRVDLGRVADAASPLSDLATNPPTDLSPLSSDPFDPASCLGPAMTPTEALARIAMAPRLKLADATLMRRTRRCTGTTPDTCGAWGTPVIHEQLLLTYSGGVTTDYKKFSFPTHIILFVQSGQPKVSIRHESDYRHDANANTRGVLFPFGSDPAENTYPVIYVWDFAPAPSRYDDLQGLLGSKAQLHIGGTCARLRVEDGISTEIAALYRF